MKKTVAFGPRDVFLDIVDTHPAMPRALKLFYPFKGGQHHFLFFGFFLSKAFEILRARSTTILSSRTQMAAEPGLEDQSGNMAP